MIKKETVIVVGACVAGLSAARMLHDLCYMVTILEGRDRIGGRIWTSSLWSDIPVDLGASWIHGQDGNPLTKLANQIGSKSVPTDYSNNVLYTTDGLVVSNDYQLEIHRIYNEILELVFNDISNHKTMLIAIQNTELWSSLSGDMQQSIMHLCNTTIEHEFAGSLNEISVKNHDDSEVLCGGDVLFPNGYGAITKHLAKDIDIKLEEIVEKIDYQNKQVIITTNNGEFFADMVIVTLPIGVLKNNSVRFVPFIPKDKQKSIEVMGSGLLDKLLLKFPYVFWDNDKDIINWISDEHGRWNEWLNLASYLGKPILLGFNAADYARKIECWTDLEIVSDAMIVLRTIYGDDIPEPESWQITRWSKDKFACGSYSFNAVGSDCRTRAILGKSIDNRVFFAGEATSEKYPATVHGAYISGINSAQHIIELTNFY